MHQLAAQQQQQIGLMQQQQPFMPQQQQQVAAGADGGTWRQGSNRSSNSNATNNSSAFQLDNMRAASATAAAVVCQADVPAYSYAAYQTACQVQPGHQLLSLPVPDSLLHSIAADLGLPLQQSSSQKQQQQQQLHAACATQPLLLQQAPMVQPLGWQGNAAAAAAPAAAGAATLVSTGSQQTAFLGSLQCGGSGTGMLHPMAQQQQQWLQPAATYSSIHSPQDAAVSAAAAAAAPAAIGAEAAAAASSNPLAGQLTGAQRAAAASHIRSMLMVAAAAGESSKAVMARALQLMQQCGDWLPHAALLQLNSMSLKLMGAQPCDLPEDVREQLITSVVNATMPEAFLRPGCSLITMDYTIASGSSSSSSSSGSEAPNSRSAAEVLQRLCSSRWFAEQEVRLQLSGTLAMQLPAQQGTSGSSSSSSSSSSTGVSAAAAGAPHVVLASSPAVLQQGWQSSWLAVSCHGLAEGEALQLTVRGGGQYYEIDKDSIAVEACGSLAASAAANAAGVGGWSSWLGAKLARHAAQPAAGAAAAGRSVLVWFKLAEQPRQGALRLEVTSGSSGTSSSVVSG
jgi:hypothetical protein